MASCYNECFLTNVLSTQASSVPQPQVGWPPISEENVPFRLAILRSLLPSFTASGSYCLIHWCLCFFVLGWRRCWCLRVLPPNWCTGCGIPDCRAFYCRFINWMVSVTFIDPWTQTFWLYCFNALWTTQTLYSLSMSTSWNICLAGYELTCYYLSRPTLSERSFAAED
jgi:hypothetical protein